MKKITLLITLMISSLGFSQNLITNGDFENDLLGTGWSGNARNVVKEGENNYNSAFVETAGQPYFVNLSYVLPMTEGKKYKLTFDAFSDRTRNLIAGIGLNQDPWINNSKVVSLTATSQTFVLELIANFSSQTSRIIFDMGDATGFVGIDNVMLEEVINTCNNGIKDGNETGIDCGGSCSECIEPPTNPAPTPPNRNATDVVSIYSDAYTSVSPINTDAGWCGTGSVVATTAGSVNNNVFAYKGNACQGITFPSDSRNLTGFTNIHVDFYIATGTDLIGKVFNLKIVPTTGGGANDVLINIDINGISPAPVPGTWYSYDRAFTVDELAKMTNSPIMHEFAVTSNLNYVVWYDNLYIHKGTTLGTAKFEKSNLKVYPNPASSNLTIEANNAIEKVSVFNVLGQEVLTKNPKANTTTIDISNLQKGTYIVRTTSQGATETTKFLKK